MISMAKIKEHIGGPIASAIIHVLVIFALIKFVTFATKETDPEVEVMIMEADAVDIEELLEPEELEPPEEMVDTITPPDVNLDFEAPPDIQDTQDMSDPMDMTALDVLDAQSPLTMKGLYAGRSAGGRAAALRAYNSKYAVITERAVLRALEWLKNNQKADGSWGGGSANNKNMAGMTGLGLLTFMAHGETPASEEYGPTVEKAIRYLVSIQGKGAVTGHGAKPGAKKDPGMLGGNVYEHGIATYALGEAYALTKIPSIKPVVTKAVDTIARGQQTHGGWDYNFKHSGRNDSSVNGWQVQALKAAKAAGIKHPRLDEVMARSLKGLQALHNPESGGTNYSAPVKNIGRGSHGLTAVSILSHQLLGQAKHTVVNRGLNYISESDCAWEGNTYTWPYYYWYYISQAKFHSGDGWKNWNARMVKTLTGHQNEDGSWPVAVPHPSDKQKKDEKKGGHGERGQGLVYSTTLAALSLQVYYRFLPSYKASAVEEDAPEEELEEDEVEIEII